MFLQPFWLFRTFCINMILSLIGAYTKPKTARNRRFESYGGLSWSYLWPSWASCWVTLRCDCQLALFRLLGPRWLHLQNNNNINNNFYLYDNKSHLKNIESYEIHIKSNENHVKSCENHRQSYKNKMKSCNIHTKSYDNHMKSCENHMKTS